MTKDVLVKVYGMQQSPDQNGDEIVLVLPGTYYYKNEKHYVIYDEYAEEDDAHIKNMLQFDKDSLSITKKGDVNASIVVEPGKSTYTQYQTPYGALQLAVNGRQLEISESPEKIIVKASYELELNFDSIGNNEVIIEILSKNVEDFSLTEE